MRIGTILVPLDGSALAEAALVKALDLWRGVSGATLVLLRAAAAHPAAVDPTEAQVEAVRDAEEYLAAAAARARALGATNVRTSVWYGPAASSIAEAAEAMHADLIVMSSHGRSGLGRFLLGSVTESVLRSTPIPILLLRPGVLAHSERAAHANEVGHVQTRPALPPAERGANR